MTELRLATWNIRKCIGLDRRRDPHRIARVIAGLGADIVVLQEADKRLGTRPAALTHEVIERETDLTPVEAGGHDSSLGFHGNAVLLAPGLAAEDLHNLRLPGLEPRGALIMDIAGKGTRIRLVAVHLGFIRAFRRAQMAAIRTRLGALEDRPTVILGDFNEWSQRGGFEPLSGFEVHSPGLTYHAARPVAPLDRIATGDGVELREAGVVRTPETRVASDHLPVWGRIRLAG